MGEFGSAAWARAEQIEVLLEIREQGMQNFNELQRAVESTAGILEILVAASGRASRAGEKQAVVNETQANSLRAVKREVADVRDELGKLGLVLGSSEASQMAMIATLHEESKSFRETGESASTAALKAMQWAAAAPAVLAAAAAEREALSGTRTEMNATREALGRLGLEQTSLFAGEQLAMIEILNAERGSFRNLKGEINDATGAYEKLLPLNIFASITSESVAMAEEKVADSFTKAQREAREYYGALGMMVPINVWAKISAEGAAGAFNEEARALGDVKKQAVEAAAGVGILDVAGKGAGGAFGWIGGLLTAPRGWAQVLVTGLIILFGPLLAFGSLMLISTTIVTAWIAGLAAAVLLLGGLAIGFAAVGAAVLALGVAGMGGFAAPTPAALASGAGGAGSAQQRLAAAELALQQLEARQALRNQSGRPPTALQQLTEQQQLVNAQNRVALAQDAVNASTSKYAGLLAATQTPIQKFKADFDRVLESLEKASVPLAQMMLNFADSFAPLLGKEGSQLIHWFGSRLPGALHEIRKVIKDLTPVFNEFMGFLGKLWDRFSPEIGPMFDLAFRAALPAIEGFLGVLGRMTDWFINTGLPVYGPIVREVFGFIGRTIEGATAAFTRFTDWGAKTFKPLIDSIMKEWNKPGVGNAFMKTLAEDLPKINTAFDYLVKTSPKWIPVVLDLVGAFAQLAGFIADTVVNVGHLIGMLQRWLDNNDFWANLQGKIIDLAHAFGQINDWLSVQTRGTQQDGAVLNAPTADKIAKLNAVDQAKQAGQGPEFNPWWTQKQIDAWNAGQPARDAAALAALAKATPVQGIMQKAVGDTVVNPSTGVMARTADVLAKTEKVIGDHTRAIALILQQIGIMQKAPQLPAPHPAPPATTSMGKAAERPAPITGSGTGVASLSPTFAESAALQAAFTATVGTVVREAQVRREPARELPASVPPVREPAREFPVSVPPVREPIHIPALPPAPVFGDNSQLRAAFAAALGSVTREAQVGRGPVHITPPPLGTVAREAQAGRGPVVVSPPPISNAALTAAFASVVGVVAREAQAGRGPVHIPLAPVHALAPLYIAPQIPVGVEQLVSQLGVMARTPEGVANLATRTIVHQTINVTQNIYDAHDAVATGNVVGRMLKQAVRS